MWYTGSVLWRKPDKILKNDISASLKGVKNEALPVKNLTFKNFFFILCKFVICAKFSKNHVLSFLLMTVLCVINGTEWPCHV